jgi:ADP-ribose pyrophosphatase
MHAWASFYQEDSMRSFELLGSEILLQGRSFKLRRDHLKTPDGRETTYEIVEHSGSVVLLPIDADRNILFVQQYRQAAGQELVELPAGTRNGDESYESCAAREIREETGMAASKMDRIGDFYLAPGYSTEFMAVFLATDLSPAPLEADEDEFLQVVKLPARRAIEMAERGEVPDAKSLAALFLAKSALQRYM